MDYDVVIIGAGPGGSITARDLARTGLRVLLVEKRREIGAPVRCGEATGIPGLKAMEVEPWEKAVASRTSGAYLYPPNNQRVELLSKKPNGLILERRMFDKQLSIEAAKAGVEVQVQTYATGLIKEGGFIKGVHLKRNNKEFSLTCNLVVGADGIEGKVGRWSGIDTRSPLSEMTSNLQYEMVGVEMVNPSVMEFYFGNKVCPGGYVWVFPKGKDVVNVGLGTRDRTSNAKIYLEDFLKNHENLASGSIIEINAGGVPVQGPIENSVGNGVLLVGDSARQVDPLTGGGIYNAMHCGRLAARIIRKCNEKNDFSKKVLMEYETIWKEEIGKGLLRSLRVKEALEKMSDEDLDHVAKLMNQMNFGDFDIKELTTAMLEMPPELIEFIQTIM